MDAILLTNPCLIQSNCGFLRSKFTAAVEGQWEMNFPSVSSSLLPKIFFGMFMPTPTPSVLHRSRSVTRHPQPVLLIFSCPVCQLHLRPSLCTRGEWLFRTYSQRRGARGYIPLERGVMWVWTEKQLRMAGLRFHFPLHYPGASLTGNLFLSAKGILPEQSIVESGQSKVSMAGVDKNNILLLCESWKARKGKISFSSSTPPWMCLWLELYLFSILFVQSFIKVCERCFCFFALFYFGGGGE